MRKETYCVWISSNQQSSYFPCYMIITPPCDKNLPSCDTDDSCLTTHLCCNVGVSPPNTTSMLEPRACTARKREKIASSVIWKTSAANEMRKKKNHLLLQIVQENVNHSFHHLKHKHHNKRRRSWQMLEQQH